MDQQSSEEKKLPDLESDDTSKVWTAQDKSCKEHYFRYVNARNVLCKDCGVGYELSGDLTLKEGHIYFKDELLV
jgi:hypothetical protein